MSEREAFAHHFEQLFNGLKERHPLQKRYGDVLSVIDYPAPHHDAFRTYPLQSLYRSLMPLAPAPSLISEFLSHQIVFINGRFCNHLSDYPAEIDLLSLEEAWIKYRSILEPRVTKQLKSETNPFVRLNHAMAAEGLFLYIPPGVDLNQPLKIVHIVQNDERGSYFPRLALFLGRGAKAQISFETSGGSQQPSFVDGVIDAHLDEQAALDWITCYEGNVTGHYFESMRIDLKKEARCNHFIFSSSQSASSARFDTRVQLLGEGSEVRLKGLSLLEGSSQSHQYIQVRHLTPHSQSMQHFKALCDGNSRSQFEGQIYVDPIAQKTQAYQLCNHLLLSDRAIAHAKPGLQILADDVKASHGATCAQLDATQLLYLQMRGLDDSAARRLLIEAFATEMGQGLFDDGIGERIQKRLSNWGKDGT